MTEEAKAELRKLDFRIMQEILGFSLNCHGETHSCDPDYGQDYVCLDNDCLAEDEFDLGTPHERAPLEYSTNVSAAFEIIYHLKDYHFELIKHSPTQYQAIFGLSQYVPEANNRPSGPETYEQWEAMADNPSLAICKAALLLSNYEKG